MPALALAHGYDTEFWWVAGIFAASAVIGGALFAPGRWPRWARSRLKPPARC